MTAGESQEPAATRFSLFGTRRRRRDYLMTFSTEFAVLLGALVLFRLAAHRWGEDGFGEFMVVRRSLSVMHLPLLLGVGIAITRYVAIALSRGDERQAGAYLRAALWLVGGSAILGAVVLLALARPVAFFLFGAPRYAMLVRVMTLPLVGLLLHGVMYGYFRGRVQMGRANLLQGVNLGLVPVVTLLVPGISVSVAFAVMGGAWIMSAAGAAVWLLLADPVAASGGPGFRVTAAALAVYGGPRVVGELALGALLALPVTFAAHYGGVRVAGFVGMGVSLVSMAGSVFAPMGHVMLPTISALADRGEIVHVRRDVTTLVVGAGLVTAVGVAVGEALAPTALAVYLGADFRAAASAVRPMLIAAVPYVVYVVFRNVLDALHVRPYNAKNLMIGLLILTAWALVEQSIAGVAVGFVAGMVVVGLLSVVDTMSVLRRARG